MLSSPFRGRTHMKRLTLARFALGLGAVVVIGLVAARPAAEGTPALAARAAVAFDMSPPLGSMEQFIPDKQVVIHPAAQSQPERRGATEGPGRGLGATPPTPPTARGGIGGAGAGGRAGRTGGPPPIPPPPPTP